MKINLKVEFTAGEYSAELQAPDGVPLCQVDGLSKDETVVFAKQMVDYAFEVLGA